jgi:hypothetical protein
MFRPQLAVLKRRHFSYPTSCFNSCLAFSVVLRGRHRQESRLVDWFAATQTLAISAVFDPPQSVIDSLNKLRLTARKIQSRRSIDVQLRFLPAVSHPIASFEGSGSIGAKVFDGLPSLVPAVSCESNPVYVFPFSCLISVKINAPALKALGFRRSLLADYLN